jgi:predicted MFS family arabinose efflux permease
MLSRANSVFSFGIYFGSALGSLTLIMDKEYGWRTSVLIVSAISMTFALLIITIKEPSDSRKNDYKL